MFLHVVPHLPCELAPEEHHVAPGFFTPAAEADPALWWRPHSLLPCDGRPRPTAHHLRPSFECLNLGLPL